VILSYEILRLNLYPRKLLSNFNHTSILREFISSKMKFHRTSSSGNSDFQCGGVERTDMTKLIVVFRVVEKHRMITA
jgi:hypothetical protein